jgi:hypothetical protein
MEPPKACVNHHGKKALLIWLVFQDPQLRASPQARSLCAVLRLQRQG